MIEMFFVCQQEKGWRDMVFETGFQAKVCTSENVLSNLLKQLNCLKDDIYLTYLSVFVTG